MPFRGNILQVKGKTEGLTIYELLDFRQPGRERPEHVVRYEQAWALYRRARFVEALEVLSGQAYDRPSAILAERCRRYMLEGTPDDWAGVYVFDSK